MTRLIACSLGLLAVLATVQPAPAAATQLIPGTGVPVPPGPSLPDLGAMPSEDELAVLYALSQLTWEELPVVLADLGLDRFWWENNIAIGVYSIPAHLPEGSAYDAFVEIEHLPSGDQIGCYLQTGTDQVVCVENWPSVSWYPLLLSPSDTLDLLFPLLAHHVAGTPVDDSYQWSCHDLRASSPNAGLFGLAGTIGGAGAATGALLASGTGASVYSSVGTFITGLVWANGAQTAAASTIALLAGASTGALVVAGAIAVVAVAAGAAAYATYVSGATNAGCPGCGEGFDPQLWNCYVRVGADVCVCEPRAEAGGDGSSSGADQGEHSPGLKPEEPEPTDWIDIDFGEYAGCDDWEVHHGADNAACAECAWSQEPQDSEPVAAQTYTAYGCDECVSGDSSNLGEVRCWTVTVEAP